MDRSQDPGGWHLKREIQLGHIITTVTVAVSVIVYVGKIEQRVAILEEARLEQQRRDARQDEATMEALRMLRGQLERMDGKLDRLIEGRSGR